MIIETTLELDRFLFNGFLIKSNSEDLGLIANIDLNYPPEEIKPLTFTLSVNGSTESLSKIHSGLELVSLAQANDCVMLIKHLNLKLGFKYAFTHKGLEFSSSGSKESATIVYKLVGTPHAEDKIALCKAVREIEND